MMTNYFYAIFAMSCLFGSFGAIEKIGKLQGNVSPLGMRRCLSNKWHVLINGKYAPIIGNICMDSLMVDVTNIDNISLNDEVFIWDNDKIKLEDLAKEAYSINYEIMCTIGSRIPRIFIKK